MADLTKTSKFDNTRRNLGKFFKDIRSELKKVIWPTRQQLVNNTITVLAACLVVGVFIWLEDAGLRVVVEQLIKK